jgi:hypothetical protein
VEEWKIAEEPSSTRASGCVEGAQTVAWDLMGSCCDMKTVLSNQLCVDTMSEMEKESCG